MRLKQHDTSLLARCKSADLGEKDLSMSFCDDVPDFEDEEAPTCVEHKTYCSYVQVAEVYDEISQRDERDECYWTLGQTMDEEGEHESVMCNVMNKQDERGEMAESDNESTRDLKAEQKHQPSLEVFCHQMSMQAELVRPRVIRKGRSDKVMLLLYEFGVHMEMSNKNGNRFLKTVSSVLKLCGVSEKLIFKDWEKMKKACDGELKHLSPVVEFEIPLGPLFHDYEDKANSKLTNRTKCFFLNILWRIGDALLQIKPADFHTKPISDGNFSTYPSGNLFKNYCSFVFRCFGSDGVALMVAFYFDEGECSKTRSACPLYMFIMNATGESFVPILLGYCPVRLAYSSDVLGGLCAMKFKGISKKHILYACSLAKRKAMDAFLWQTIKPILDFRECGLKVQVGTGNYSIVKTNSINRLKVTFVLLL